MSFAVREIQPTPNPNALKFVLDQTIEEVPRSFFSAEAAKDHPIASQLFAIDGVCSVLMLGDFVTVNKRAEAKWKPLTDRVKRVLAEATKSSGKP